MGERWSDYERAAERGPTHLLAKVIVGIALLSALVFVLGAGFGWFGEAAQVTREEFGPRAMLGKYEWFKDAAAQLEKKQAVVW